jgi:hypothetical protein
MSLQLPRRGLLIGLAAAIATPAIVRFPNIMRVSSTIFASPRPLFDSDGFVDWSHPDWRKASPADMATAIEASFRRIVTEGKMLPSGYWRKRPNEYRILMMRGSV